MVIFYFSGTGNSKHIAELFAQKMNCACHSIEEDTDFEALIKSAETIAFCYPIYFSRVPRIMREFVSVNTELLKGKKLIIFCTQLILSGDGARAFAALFPKNYMQVIYAEHFFMPNNVTNFSILPDSLISDKRIKKIALKAGEKMQKVCGDIKRGKVHKRGFNVGSRALGLFQAWLVKPSEKKANNSVKITQNCTNCELCVLICPMKNLVLENEKITHRHNCTVCYRCVNKCPQKAITVAFHGKVKKQYKGL
ncbi:MAG: EFR1 family ferrodoxin [Oscillospiraceae bacterium]|jgi:ferredoxin|nr:EFR1 family ferrodoxin [Oscillospiraceae bacterium]